MDLKEVRKVKYKIGEEAGERLFLKDNWAKCTMAPWQDACSMFQIFSCIGYHRPRVKRRLNELRKAICNNHVDMLKLKGKLMLYLADCVYLALSSYTVQQMWDKHSLSKPMNVRPNRYYSYFFFFIGVMCTKA